MQDFIKKSRNEVAIFFGNVADATGAELPNEDPDYLRIVQDLNLIEKQTNELLNSIKRNQELFGLTLKSYSDSLNLTVEPFVISEYNLLYTKANGLRTSSNSIISVNQIFNESTIGDSLFKELFCLAEMISVSKQKKDKRRKYQILLRQEESDMRINGTSTPTDDFRKYTRKFDQYSREFSDIVKEMTNVKRIAFSKAMNVFVFGLKQTVNDCCTCTENRMTNQTNTN